MVAGGARRLILCGRSDIPPRKQWSQLPPDSPTYRRLERIRALEHQGATIHLARLDVGDAEALAAFVREFHAEGWPEIRGVVHCAGVFDAVDISPEAFARIARGKALGAFNITRTLPDLDLLVLFSSSSSVVPQPNLNYAAANAVLRGVERSLEEPGAGPTPSDAEGELDPQAHLSLPAWLWRRFVDALGSTAAREAALGMLEPEPLWLTAFSAAARDSLIAEIEGRLQQGDGGRSFIAIADHQVQCAGPPPRGCVICAGIQ